eukprot:2851349-Pyramimonas_sp.AAC.1
MGEMMTQKATQMMVTADAVRVERSTELQPIAGGETVSTQRENQSQHRAGTKGNMETVDK